HVIRHTAATLMREFGEDLAVVQEALGHSDIRTTRGYQKVRVGLTRRVADKMDKGLFGATTTDLATARRRRRKAASGD
ncbi:MAG: Phage integrase family, partial [Micromonosporaceae bacterium]|nr:Phage integrase family [Micromonosporaceae bacterium]